MKKKIKEMFLSAAVIAVLVGIVWLVTGVLTDNTPEIGKVFLSTSEQAKISPLENEIYRTTKKVKTEHKRLDAREIDASLPLIIYDEGFKADYEIKSSKGTFQFKILDKDYNLYREIDTALRIPKDPGDYIICMEIQWGSNNENIGMEYYYKLRIA
jgi:hypothetical protein